MLHVLNDLFERVLIPPAVKDELDAMRPGLSVGDLSTYGFVEVRAPQDQNQVQQFLRTLDRGESEALALALEIGTQLILMDESSGRAVAAQHSIVPLGALGVLLRAKSRGLIPVVRPLIDKLDQLGFFMSDELKNNVLRLAGE